jgi:hypothetical protein
LGLIEEANSQEFHDGSVSGCPKKQTEKNRSEVDPVT